MPAPQEVTLTSDTHTFPAVQEYPQLGDPESWIGQALGVVTGDRRHDYDHPLVNLLRTAVMASVYFQQVFTPTQVAMLLVILKQARQIKQHKTDNFVDMHGYLMCYEAIDTKMREMGYQNGAEHFNGITLAEMAAILTEMEGVE